MLVATGQYDLMGWFGAELGARVQGLNGPFGSIASSFLQVALGWNLSYRTFGLCLAEGGPAPADSFSAGRLLPLL
jgi:hypothetical protein